MGAAQDFLQYGPRIYRGKHLIDAGDGWTQRNTRLHIERIDRALEGQETVGYFGASVSDCVALDLDDHHGEAWSGGAPSSRLVHLYRSVCGELTTPSLVYRSPRGLHTYYKLESLYPSPILSRLAMAKTMKHGAEVRPTMTQGLRFPRLVDRLDPDTLAPTPEKGLQDIPVRFAGELFGIDHTPMVLREQLQDGHGARIGSARDSLIARVERKVLQDGLQGASNEALCHLAPVYYLAGYQLEEAVYRFRLLTLEAGYHGELENEHRLRQRLATLYRGMTDRGAHNDAIRARLKIEPGLWDAAICEALAKQAPFAKQREKPLFRFLSGLFDWLNYQDAIQADPAAMAVWSYLYPYYRHNTRNGWYPFPSSVLNDLNSRYYNVLPYLIDAGFLTPAPFKYQVAGRTRDGDGWQAGVCKHYAVNREPGAFL